MPKLRNKKTGKTIKIKKKPKKTIRIRTKDGTEIKLKKKSIKGRIPKSIRNIA